MSKVSTLTALASIALVASLGLTGMASAQVVTVELGAELEERRLEIGPRDVERLTERLQERIEASLERVGASESLVVTVTLNEVWQDRPTRSDLERRPGLSYRSFSRGGASISASFSDPDAGFSGEHNYEWRQTDISSSRFAATWFSANRTIDRFSRALGNSVEAEQAGS